MTILCFLWIILAFQISAHPTGNMISVGNTVLWSYIDPIDDFEHHACIMIWREGSAPQVLIKSEFPASDFILSSNYEDIYILERRFIQSSETFQSRILKMKIGEKPIEIWSWFNDEWKVGEGGYYMPNDSQIVFAKYPEVFLLEKNQKPIKYNFTINKPIVRIRLVENNEVLLLGENSCMLIDKKGKLLKSWKNLLDENVENAPLSRNSIFDIDYRNGELLFAYWGKRSFETISNNGERKVIYQLNEPYAPHWVSYFKNSKLFFSSKLIFDGSTPKPNLILYKSSNEIVEIWKK